MKLRNKKTGEIGNLVSTNWDEVVLKVLDDNGVQLGKYTSLAELNEEWEDVSEEPKEYWYIGDSGEVWSFSHYYLGTEIEETHREIGNLFETKEEAEKAVKKLKAWHKLMDYWETEVLGWEIRDMPTGANWRTVNVKFIIKSRKEPMELLDILFGGEK